MAPHGDAVLRCRTRAADRPAPSDLVNPMPTPRTAALLAALSFALASPAQQITSGPEPDRKAFAVTVQTAEPVVLANVAISYGAARWRDEYSAALPQLRGNNYSRIGVGWWTTIDTIGAIEIGGVRIEAGSYYAGLRVDSSGAFSLLLFDSKRAMQQRLLPFSTPLYTGAAQPDLAVPLTFAQDASAKDSASTLEIAIATSAQEPTKGTLALRWGPHEATAPVRLQLPADKGGAGGTGK